MPSVPPAAETFPWADLTPSTGIISGSGVLKGFSLRETTGAAAAVVRLHDGQSANGRFLAVTAFAASESQRDWFGEWGIYFNSGLFVEQVSGTVEGVFWIIPEMRIQGVLQAEGQLGWQVVGE